LKSGDTVGVARELFGQNLDCHIPAKPLILSLVHLSHAALAELACDFVVTQRLADHEGYLLQIDSRCNAMQ
jgi:hypothetical protein